MTPPASKGRESWKATCVMVDPELKKQAQEKGGRGILVTLMDRALKEYLYGESD